MAQWDNYVNSHPEGTPCHLSCWLRTIGETYPYESHLYVLEDETDGISGVMPAFLIKGLFKGRQLVTLPFSDYGYPLTQTEDGQRQILSPVLEEMKDKIRNMEIRGPLGIHPDFSSQTYYKRHAIKLSPDVAEVKKNIDKRTIQYCIRKAQREGVEIREDNSPDGLEAFYRLNQLTRKKHGVPVQPRRFFCNLHKNILERGNGSICLACLKSRAIAAGLFIRHRSTVYYKYNASDPAFMKKYAPNHLLTWTAIEDACRKGFSFFDFGRSALNNPGLIRYKEMWGAASSDLPYNYYPAHYRGAGAKTHTGFLYQMITLFWRLIPDSIASRMGPLIYRYLG